MKKHKELVWCMKNAQIIPSITSPDYFSPSKWTYRVWNFPYKRRRMRCPKCKKMLTLRCIINPDGNRTFLYPPHKTNKLFPAGMNMKGRNKYV